MHHSWQESKPSLLAWSCRRLSVPRRSAQAKNFPDVFSEEDFIIKYCFFQTRSFSGLHAWISPCEANDTRRLAHQRGRQYCLWKSKPRSSHREHGCAKDVFLDMSTCAESWFMVYDLWRFYEQIYPVMTNDTIGRVCCHLCWCFAQGQCCHHTPCVAPSYSP